MSLVISCRYTNRQVGESGALVSIEDFDVARDNKGDICAPSEGQGLLEQAPWYIEPPVGSGS